ncbi:PP2C family protein-serine/threonine phosphatase [Streptomyces pristinaespiralis]|uniref:Magnesium or manganese-dependent protein phosphatase n=1 Tax=Streptomyces pristinaespiralis (strain ATCC 25486 / DSM 40338 / CBS 914.69 / JCM 4507 / KCC S-0507 / NBRC 13074 / NRRL 2958 / 5647) TaxID=457429 RepID=B5H5U8_STRE2|nr:magnesium or manganese-dependent protein phosphatase [Streptomyces pristinaespiralis ATCC 25486]
MLDITLRVRVDVDALIAAQNDMGVCDAIERNAPAGKPAAMSAPHLPKVAGIDSTVPAPAHTPSTLPPVPAAPPAAGAVLQDRLAGWVSDLTTLHELTERLIRTGTLDDALEELLGAGAALVGARRGLVVLEPPRDAARDSPLEDDRGPGLAKGLGLTRSDLGHIETVPRGATAYGRILDSGRSGVPGPIAHPDLLGDDSLHPLHREVAARLGYSASYTVPLATEDAGTLGAAVWLYDEPATPVERQCHLVGLYMRSATEHLGRLIELEQARATVATVAEELLPSRLPRVPGVQLAARHHSGPRGGGDWYDALPLPEGALGLAVGSVSGRGPSALAAMGRLRASLRAYAVMEGEDPVAVLSDLELLLRLTEPARTATALFAYAEPAERKIVLAGAGHTPPLVIGDQRTEFVETSLSAPLGMLACWEAPSVELRPQPGETVLLYTDGLLRRTGDPMDRAFTRLHSAAAGVPRALRGDPAAIADHVLRTVLPEGPDATGDGEDIVLLAARFD